jgi:hypothetical protein
MAKSQNQPDIKNTQNNKLSNLQYCFVRVTVQVLVFVCSVVITFVKLPLVNTIIVCQP